MALAVVGTPQDISSSLTGANPAAFNVTWESGANAGAFSWSWYNGTAGHGLASATLNGVTADESFEIPTASGDQNATGVSAWYNIAAGTRSLDVAWDAAPAEGPSAAFTCYSDVDTTAGFLDVDAANETGTTACSVTLTGIAADDLVTKFDQRFDSGETPPGNTTSWTSLLTGGINSEGFRLASIVATGTSQACPSENDNYSTVVAWAFTEAAGGAFEIDAQPGSIVITGAQAGALGDRLVNAQAGSFVVTGQAATVVPARVINAVPGSYVVTGLAASLLADRLLSTEPGSYTILGFAADLVAEGAGAFEINAEPGAFAIVGLDAELELARALNAEPGSYLVVGVDAELLADRALPADPGAYTIIGTGADLVWSGEPVDTGVENKLFGQRVVQPLVMHGGRVMRNS
jgi:hypothetical protein